MKYPTSHLNFPSHHVIENIMASTLNATNAQQLRTMGKFGAIARLYKKLLTYLLTYLYNNSPVFWLDIFIWHSVNINSTYSGSIMTCSWFSRTFKNTYLSMFGLGTEKKTLKKFYPQKVYMYIENSGKSSCIVGNIGSTVLQQTGRTIPSIALFFPWVWINQYSQRPLFTKIYKWEIAKRVVQGYFRDAWLADFKTVSYEEQITRVVQRYFHDAWLADFIFSWNVNLGKYCSWSVIWRFCVTREELGLLTDIRDFTTLLYVILRREFFEWLEPAVRYGNCNIVPWLSLSWFYFLQTLFSSDRADY